MTKKHFEKIAEDINKQGIIIQNMDNCSYDEKWFAFLILEDLTNDLLNTFSEFNNNFDMDKFIKACGIRKLKLELEREQATKIASGIL